LEQASKSFAPEFLSTVAATVLLGVSGAMCLLIALMLLSAQRRRSALPRAEGQEVNGHDGLDSGKSGEITGSKAASFDPRE
jgi:hypothetical protein